MLAQYLYEFTGKNGWTDSDYAGVALRIGKGTYATHPPNLESFAAGMVATGAEVGLAVGSAVISSSVRKIPSNAVSINLQSSSNYVTRTGKTYQIAVCQNLHALEMLPVYELQVQAAIIRSLDIVVVWSDALEGK